MKNKNHFILMADIVDSRIKDQEQLMQHFKEVTSHLNKTNKNKLLSPLTITLGDEFQGVVKTLPFALDIILELEEQLIHKQLDFKLRYVLLEGEIETEINTDIAYGMLGSGLTQAREALTEMKSSNSRFYFSIINETTSEALNHALIVYQSIVDSWRVEKDYFLVSEFLTLKDYKKVAEKLDKTRSQIWKREISLNMEGYIALKKVIKYIGEYGS